jgi:hypothetical protein
MQSQVSSWESLIAGKVTRWGVEIRDECPAYYINKKVANCRDLSPNERCCMGLLNVLMKKYGYAFVSDAQLAHWLGLDKPNSAGNMLRKLSTNRFIANKSRKRGKHEWVVLPEWRNPEKKTAPLKEKHDDRVPF